MSDTETDSFIREVEEEVRQDRMFRLWKKWGPFVLAGIVVVVGAAAAWNWMKAQEQAAAEALGDRFLAADPGAPEDFQAIADDSGEGGLLADLALAAAMAEAGDVAAAGVLYRQIAERPGLTPEYRDFARLQALRILSETQPGQALEEVRELTAPGAPYRLLAAELQAVLKLNTGDVAGAHEELRALIAEPEATDLLRQRAGAILEASGGRLTDGEG